MLPPKTYARQILSRAWNEQHKVISGSLDGDEFDASVLLLHEIGFVSARDPRFVSTVEQIGARLGRNGMLLRYDAPDDFGEPTVSFAVCTFWYVDALAAIGRVEEARAMFEKLLAGRNHIGLLSEDIDPATGELWGNFPQTYSLVGSHHLGHAAVARMGERALNFSLAAGLHASALSQLDILGPTHGGQSRSPPSAWLASSYSSLQ